MTRTRSNLSLELPPGARVGLVGASGTGKSTYAAVMMRFLDPRTGAQTLADTDLRDLTLDDVRRRVGLVDDDPHVFASTLVENVRLARPSASDVEVETALRRAAWDPGWTPSPTGCTPGWATATPRCPEVSGPGSRSPARS